MTRYPRANFFVAVLGGLVVALSGCSGPEYITVSQAANKRCAPYGGVQSIGPVPDEYGPGTVVCKDGVARDFTTRIR